MLQSIKLMISQEFAELMLESSSQKWHMNVEMAVKALLVDCLGVDVTRGGWWPRICCRA